MCEEKKEEESDMSATMNIERPCTILESLEKSLPGSKNDA